MRDDHGLRKIAHIRADLGESPVWDARKGLLYFVDISGGKINVLRPQARVETVHKSAARIGALGLTDKGNLIFKTPALPCLMWRLARCAGTLPPSMTGRAIAQRWRL